LLQRVSISYQISFLLTNILRSSDYRQSQVIVAQETLIIDADQMYESGLPAAPECAVELDEGESLALLGAH
jgi:hypothetical protein